jgi:chromate reductase, NAD(P)H dehydrogenase (quinone)
MTEPVRILGFAGSLRKGSYNRALLRAAAELMPEDARLEIFDLDGIPGYNQDLESMRPQKVTEFKAKIRAADAILIVTPEYNYSIPGVLNNAIDWASRPLTDNSFQGKPVAIMSASTGMLGGARAQYHLRQTFVFLDIRSINKPEVIVTFANQKFDENGKLTDEKTRDLLQQLLRALIDWTQKLKSKPR